jgi:hypothetical protein
MSVKIGIGASICILIFDLFLIYFRILFYFNIYYIHQNSTFLLKGGEASQK